MWWLVLFNREEELETIDRVLNSEKAELIIVYGRRRVGKTTLVESAAKNFGRKLYLFTVRGSLEDILENFAEDIREQLNIPVSFSRWQDFIEFLRIISSEPVVVIIDEFQRLNEASPATISRLQDAWDRFLSGSKIKLILVGSVIGMVERLALSGNAPLYGRKTCELKLRPLPYMRIREYFDGVSEEERIRLYGCFGGTPAYFTSVDPSKSLRDNIVELVLKKGAKFAREPEELLAQEVRSPSTYMSILSLLARRGNGRGLTLSKIHVRRGSPTEYLQRLEKMDLIERIELLDVNKYLYRVFDEFFRFWFTFIYPRLSLIERGIGEKLIDFIIDNLDRYLSVTFEKILEEIILLKGESTVKDMQLPLVYRVGLIVKGGDVDVVGIGDNEFIVGEAKWWDKPIPRGEVEKFIARKYEIAKKFGVKVKGIMIAKRGFTDPARKFENEDLILLSIKDFDNLL